MCEKDTGIELILNLEGAQVCSPEPDTGLLQGNSTELAMLVPRYLGKWPRDDTPASQAYFRVI